MKDGDKLYALDADEQDEVYTAFGKLRTGEKVSDHLLSFGRFGRS
jgi:hypothetical protein